MKNEKTCLELPWLNITELLTDEFNPICTLRYFWFCFENTILDQK